MKVQIRCCNNAIRGTNTKGTKFLLLSNNLCVFKNYNIKKIEKKKKIFFCNAEKINYLIKENNSRVNFINSTFIYFHSNNKIFSHNNAKDKIENAKIKLTFFENDKLFYNHVINKLIKGNQKSCNKISNEFFYELNKFHINFITNYLKNSIFFNFTKTSKIFFVILVSFSIFLTFFLLMSSNFLEYNIILKYHIKFHSLLFSFFSSYYLGLQIGNYYFANHLHYINSLFFLFNSIFSMFIADYNIWAGYYYLSSNYLLYLLINCYNLYFKKIPSHVFKSTNKIIIFSLFSNYLALNKGKYIEKNIELLKDENNNMGTLKLLKILPYFL
ncbi:conserved protein, unknown function [Hepatocystis sp. ex Piliocolobus tephrosceles]|nr:conserved protein, unknown function [Hepatocystis sp. ex Piliocolobus tephrosceles]